MKAFLKRYKVFLLLIIVNIIVGFALPEIGLKSLNLTKKNFIEMISVIPPIFILLGLLDVWVDRATMMKYTGKNSGLKGVLIAFLLGSAAAGPLYAAFPIAGIMLKKGSSLFNVFVFIGAWSTTKIPMLTFEAASLGIHFMITRLILSIIGILIIAGITEKLLNQEQQKKIYEINQ
ncbi:putative permease [Anaerotignum neopropionicum]|uniref:Putative permease n=1 Tax=Anaerotignum neopropionicum TaxID=36847 RepID=A0A136WER4_9FIRM|nr:permease [Anaerotignum neopropionicum]KXL52849.1 putative permease [Anaerotignum neopropionicum]